MVFVDEEKLHSFPLNFGMYMIGVEFTGVELTGVNLFLELQKSNILSLKNFKKFKISSRKDCNCCLLVILTQNPPTVLSQQKRKQKKNNLLRNNSNHKKFWVSFIYKNCSRLLIKENQILNE